MLKGNKGKKAKNKHFTSEVKLLYPIKIIFKQGKSKHYEKRNDNWIYRWL